VPADWRNKIIHARLVVGDQVLMGSDGTPAQPCEEIQGSFVSLNVETPVEAERIFHALEKNGTVKMALEQTFWAVRFGMCVDQFGVPWMVNCEQAA
jgi:PhnB protein